MIIKKQLVKASVRPLIATDPRAAQTATDRLLSRIAHELRTPLSATLLWAKLLNTSTLPDLDLLREGLKAIETSALEQQVLIDQLLDVSHILTGKLRLQCKTVALRPFVLAVLKPWQALAKSSGIRLTVLIDPLAGSIRADEKRLKQILTHLLSNALKFTPQGGKVGFQLNRHGKGIGLRLTDTGRGITPAALPMIFERFAASRDSGGAIASGLGIGLYLTGHLVKLHGGTIRAQSAGLDHGATFTVLLPQVPPVPRPGG